MKFVLSDVVQCFYLIEEDVLAIGPISGEVFENTRRRDAVLETESLPELKSNWKRKKSKQNYAKAEDFHVYAAPPLTLVAALAQLKRNHFTWHRGVI